MSQEEADSILEDLISTKVSYLHIKSHVVITQDSTALTPGP